MKRVHSVHWTKIHPLRVLSKGVFDVGSLPSRVHFGSSPGSGSGPRSDVKPTIHPFCFLGFFFALGSASVDGLDEGVALARCEDPEAWLFSKSAVA